MTDPTTALEWLTQLISVWDDMPTGITLMVTAGLALTFAIGGFRRLVRLGR